MRAGYTSMEELDRLCADEPDDREAIPSEEPATKRKRGQPKIHCTADIVRLRRQGLLTREIAQRLGIPHSSVRWNLWQAGMSKAWVSRQRFEEAAS